MQNNIFLKAVILVTFNVKNVQRKMQFHTLTTSMLEKNRNKSVINFKQKNLSTLLLNKGDFIY